MKKIYSLVILSGALFTMFACSKEVDHQEIVSSKETVFTCLSEDAQVKTSLSGKNVIWNANDKIKLAYKNTDEEQALSELLPSSIENDGAVAKFTGGISNVASSSNYFAVYPSNALTSFDYNSGVGVVSFPSVQVAAANSFGQDANVTTAYTSGSAGPVLNFKNLGAIVSLTVNSASVGLASIELSSTATMAGDVTFKVADTGIPSIISVANGKNSIKIEGSFVNGSKYYFAVLPGTYDSIEITFKNSDGKIVKAMASDAVTLTRNANMYLGEINIPEDAWPGTNLALHKTVTASSNEGAAFQITYGNPAFSWQAASTGSENVIIDLGAEKKSNNIIINWSTGAYATSFDVMVSTDGTAYTNVYAARGYSCPSDGICSIVYEPTKARYIKVQMNTCVNVWNYTINEIELYYDPSLAATPTPNYAKGKTATASSEFYPASNAVMGNEEFCWVANSHGEEWFMVDMEDVLSVKSVTIIWPEANAAKSFEIQISTDGSAFDTVASETAYDPASDSGRHVVNFTRKPARFVKLIMKEPVLSWDYWIKEFEIH